ncbi:MAG: hypothetical protein OHK0013_14280 [Sandaracinaceae bacterium]
MRSRFGRRPLALAAALLPACGPSAPPDDAGTDALATDAWGEDAGAPDASTLDAASEGGGRATLSDGVEVVVDDEGAITLARPDGSALVALAGAPHLRTYEQVTRMSFGMYTTTRSDEVRHPLFFRALEALEVDRPDLRAIR